jgi:hypothetical protein
VGRIDTAGVDTEDDPDANHRRKHRDPKTPERTGYVVISPIVGVAGLMVLIAFQGLALVGRWRRGQGRKQAQAGLASSQEPSERDLRAVRRPTRGAAFLSRQPGRAYHATTSIAALILIALPFIRLETSARLGLWLPLNGLIIVGAVVMPGARDRSDPGHQGDGLTCAGRCGCPRSLIQAFGALEYERYTAAVVPALHTRVCGASHEMIPKRE